MTPTPNHHHQIQAPTNTPPKTPPKTPLHIQWVLVLVVHDGEWNAHTAHWQPYTVANHAYPVLYDFPTAAQMGVHILPPFAGQRSEYTPVVVELMAGDGVRMLMIA